MTTTIKTSFALAAANLAISGVAHAESVKISLVGKDAATIHAEIVKAAHLVCTNVSADSIAITAQSECVADTIAKANADLRGLARTRLAQANTAAIRGER
jgi:hypothetical protein